MQPTKLTQVIEKFRFKKFLRFLKVFKFKHFFEVF